MTSHAHLLPRYQRLREVGRAVANALVKTLSKDVMDEGGRALGILHQGILVFDSEDEMAILMDYCIHDVRRQGRNAIERYLAESPPPPDSDEMVFLQGLREARYGLFLVEEVERGVGVQARDPVRGDTFFLVDVGLGTSAVPGLVLATRVTRPDNIPMTTGAGLPAGTIPQHAWAGWLQEAANTWAAFEKKGPVSPERESERTATLIRSCLERGAGDNIRYQDVPRGAGHPRPLPGPGPRRLPPAGGKAHVGRNDPCPCGSGKKFKHCCARRR
jgi:hypothetical protein